MTTHSRSRKAAGSGPAAPATISAFEPLFLTLLEVEAELPAWRRLSDHAMEPNPFLRAEFLIPYLRYAEPEAISLAAVRRRSDGFLVALAPLGRRPLGLGMPTAQIWTHPYAPLGTPLLAPECAVEAAIKFLRLVAMQMGPFLAMPEQRLDGAVAAAFEDAAAQIGAKSARMSTYRRPVLAAHDRMEHFVAGLSSQRRRRIAKGYRLLKGKGHLVRDHLRGPHALAAFDDFLALEEAGWKGDNGTAITSNPHHAAFAREAMKGLAGIGGLMLDRLRLDGETIAAVVSLRDGPRAVAWKTAFDESHSRASPGIQATLAAMENYFSFDDLVEVDSLAGRAPSHIDDLWSERALFSTLTIAGGHFAGIRSLAARADVAAYDMARRAVHGLAALRRRVS